MRGLGMMLALEALDAARGAGDGGTHGGPETARKAAARGDGEPDDGLDPAGREARMTAWRAWARRRDLTPSTPLTDVAVNRRREQGTASG